MKYLLLLIYLLTLSLPLPLSAGAQSASSSASLEEESEKLQKIEDVQNVFFVRITILNDSLNIKEEELKITKDAYDKIVISEEIKIIKENIAREKITLQKKIEAIEKGFVDPTFAGAPPGQNQDDARTQRAKSFFNYFQKK